LYPDDDKPTVSILDPDPNDSVGSQVYVRATVSCVDDIDYVEVCFTNPGTDDFYRWYSLTEYETYWDRTVDLPAWFDTGSGYVTVRATTINGIYGYDWVAVTYT